jgi:hypothetical protein
VAIYFYWKARHVTFFGNNIELEEHSLMSCNTMYYCDSLMFQRNILSPSSWLTESQARSQQNKAASWATYICWFLVWLPLWLCRWSQCVPLKYKVLPELRSITSQNTTVIIVTAVKTLNPTSNLILYSRAKRNTKQPELNLWNPDSYK